MRTSTCSWTPNGHTCSEASKGALGGEINRHRKDHRLVHSAVSRAYSCVGPPSSSLMPPQCRKLERSNRPPVFGVRYARGCQHTHHHDAHGKNMCTFFPSTVSDGFCTHTRKKRLVLHHSSKAPLSIPGITASIHAFKAILRNVAGLSVAKVFQQKPNSFSVNHVQRHKPTFEYCLPWPIISTCLQESPGLSVSIIDFHRRASADRRCFPTVD